MRALDIFILAFATILALSSPTEARFEKSPFQLQNAVINTPSHSIAPATHFNISADVTGKDQRIAFDLETNNDLTTPHTNVQYLDIHGNTKQLDSPSYRSAKGSVWVQSAGRSWRNVGWARIVIVREGPNPLFEGTFTVRSKQYEIKLKHLQDDASLTVSPIASSSLTGVSHADSSQSRLQPHCMATPHSTLNTGLGMGISQLQRRGESYVDSIGSTTGCPQTRQVAYIGVVADCSFTAAFDSVDAVHRNILNIVNTASVVFENSFNISLGLQNLTISDPQCPESTSEATSWNSACTNGDINWRLTRFSAWRSTVADTNAFWTLMTDCHNSGAEVGVSWVGELCNTGSGNYYSSQSGIGANVVAHTGAQWQVFTHEAAHMFGAVHDCDSKTCEQLANTTCCPLSSNTCDADGDFIMNPSSSRAMSRFSPCTIGNVCSGLGIGRVDSHCLVADNPSINTTGVHNGQCGNGVLEPGEACDCGANAACGEDEARCCDMMTCQWRGGDQCEKFNPKSGGESWIDRHLGLVIGLSVGLGGGLLLSVLAVVGIWCWRRRRVGKRFSSLSSTGS